MSSCTSSSFQNLSSKNFLKLYARHSNTCGKMSDQDRTGMTPKLWEIHLWPKKEAKLKFPQTSPTIRPTLFRATIYARTFALPDSKGNLQTLIKLYVEPRGSMPEGSFHASVLSPVGNQAETFALAIDQLRLLRNLLSHLSSSEKINKTTFDQYTEHTKDAFTALGVATDSIDYVKSLPESHFPTEEVARLERKYKLLKSIVFLD